MKIDNLKSLKLVEKGLSAKTVSKLTESQVATLYKKLVIFEQVTEVPTKKTYKVGPKGGKVGNIMVSTDPNTKEVIVTTETEMTEDETDDVTDKNALGASALQDLTGQEAPHDANDMAPDGMDDDSDDNRNMMGMSESKKTKKNPWAICTSQLGNEFGTRERHLWNAKEKNKYERCVKDVKKSLKEGKNPISLFIENKIMEIVERNLPPKITKGDLMKYLSEENFASKHVQSNFGVKSKPKVKKEVGENSPATAPTTKPAPTKPGTKTPPKPRPSHPGKNPNPGEKEAPKAKKVSPEKAKEEVMDLIMNILQN